MKIDEILKVIEDLSHAQGYYGRLYRQMINFRDNHKEDWEIIVAELELQDFKEPLDVVMYFET